MKKNIIPNWQGSRNVRIYFDMETENLGLENSLRGNRKSRQDTDIDMANSYVLIDKRCFMFIRDLGLSCIVSGR